MTSPTRSRSIARIALGVTLVTSASLIAFGDRPAEGRRKMMFDDEFAPSLQNGFDGPSIGGRTAPAVEAPAHLVGGPIAMIGERALVIDADSGTLVLVDAKGSVLDSLKI